MRVGLLLNGTAVVLRPSPAAQTRNAAVRTLFMAVGSHGGKFPRAVWQELFWEQLFPLVQHIHHLSTTSSQEEAAAVELGKERGGSRSPG